MQFSTVTTLPILIVLSKRKSFIEKCAETEKQKTGAEWASHQTMAGIHLNGPSTTHR